jgi:hypothetical protein
MEISPIDTFLATHMAPRRPGLPTYFERACRELGIHTPMADEAAEIVAVLMPAGGPACEEIPIEWVGTTKDCRTVHG